MAFVESVLLPASAFTLVAPMHEHIISLAEALLSALPGLVAARVYFC